MIARVRLFSHQQGWLGAITILLLTVTTIPLSLQIHVVPTLQAIRTMKVLASATTDRDLYASYICAIVSLCHPSRPVQGMDKCVLVNVFAHCTCAVTFKHSYFVDLCLLTLCVTAFLLLQHVYSFVSSQLLLAR